MRLFIFQDASFIENEEARRTYIRIPEVLKEIRRAESLLGMDLIGGYVSGDEEIKKNPRLKSLLSFVTQKGLYDRWISSLQSREAVLLIGPLGASSIIETSSGRQPIDETLQQLAIGLSQGLTLLNQHESRLLGETTTLDRLEWGVYERISGRTLQLPISETDRLRLIKVVMQSRRVTQIIFLGLMNSQEENIARQMLGSDVTLLDSLGADAKLGILKESLLSSFNWV